MNQLEKYAAFIPLVYLVVTAGLAMASHLLGLPKELTGAIVGAGLMRVKIPVKLKLN